MVEEKLIASASDLVTCCARLTACERIGLDTEFVGEDSFHPHLCLIQVATPDALYLIDPFTVGSLDAFWKLIIDPSREIIVHAGREEVRICHLQSGHAPGKLFDLQLAAGLVGLSYPLSHGGLVGELLGVQLRKAETLTEWRERPLTPDQLGYAFDDVRYLLAAFEKINTRLRRLDRRSWADEEFARLREQGLPLPTADGYGERWRKLRGVGGLSRRQLATAREVFVWREGLAARENRPPRVLLRDDLIVEIARRNPKSDRDLKVMRGLPRRHTTAIMQAVERARSIPQTECPAVAEREQDPTQVGVIVNVLAAVLADSCRRLQLASGLVASNQDLKRLVRSRLGDTVSPNESLLMQGWRREQILPELEAVLDGRRALYIADVKSEAPFRFVPIDAGDMRDEHGVV